MEKKLKHLEIVQNVIGRMANNSFFIKGWCITLVSALLALESQNTNTKLITVTLLPLIMFWVLDAYFLKREHLFRKLYEEVCLTKETEISFSMDTSAVKNKANSFPKILFSRTLVLFYGTILLAIILVPFLVMKH